MATINVPPMEEESQLQALPTTESSARRFWRRFSRHRLAIVGLAILLFLIFVSIFAPLLTPYSPTTANLTQVLLPPSPAHPLGTDELGQDVLARLMYGGRVSFLVGFSSMIISTTIGVVYGALSGYLGGVWDRLMMRFVDLVMSFPTIFLLLVVLNLTGSNASVGLMILYLGLFGWTGLARIVRSQVLSLKSQEYVEAARAQGSRTLRIVFKHVLPGAMAPVWVSAAFGVAGAMLSEASLDFLGFGLSPDIPSWGNMLDSAENYIVTHPIMILAPGLIITIAVVSINFIGDALRDALDPRSTTGMQRIG
ncbi:MAG: ABC transporter permease [Firmicutes bacterium]|nr:ABC transporter permease [Bacillota bacterium]